MARKNNVNRALEYRAEVKRLQVLMASLSIAKSELERQSVEDKLRIHALLDTIGDRDKMVAELKEELLALESDGKSHSDRIAADFDQRTKDIRDQVKNLTEELKDTRSLLARFLQRALSSNVAWSQALLYAITMPALLGYAMWGHG